MIDQDPQPEQVASSSFESGNEYTELGEDLGKESPEAKVARVISILPKERTELAKVLEVDESELQVVLDNAESMRSGARTAIRMPRNSFDSFLEDGIAKTYRETGFSVGNHGSTTAETGRSDYDLSRQRFEGEMGLLDSDGVGPIYGYLENTNSIDTRVEAPTYGKVSVILKPNVTQRSTYSVGDSLRSGVKLYGIEDAVVISEARDLDRQKGISHSQAGDAFFIEAQVSGGVSLDDVEAVSITYDGIYDKSSQDRPALRPEDYPADMRAELAKIHQAMPDAKVIIRSSVNGSYPLRGMLELARDNPNDTFIGFYETFSSPHRELRANDEVNNDFNYQTAVNDRQQANDRLSNLREKLLERWRELGEEGDPPKNFVLTLADRRF